MWLRRAEEEARAEGRPLAIDWRTFSLEQVNLPKSAASRAPEGRNSKTPDVKVWDHPERRWRSVAALAAANAAKHLDPERFPAFHMTLFEARHLHARDLSDPAVLDDAAEAAGYDRAAFAEARAGRAAWQALGREHLTAAARGVFGTPTLVFGGRAVFIKMQAVPDDESALGLLEEVIDFQTRAPYMLELKTPEAFTARARP